MINNFNCKKCGCKIYLVEYKSISKNSLITKAICKSCKNKTTLRKSLKQKKYGTINIRKKPLGYNSYALHRWVYEKYHKVKLRKSDIIHHVNRSPGDNRPCNLKKMTNSNHIILHLNGKTKLSIKDVRDIRVMLKKDISSYDIAKKYNVTYWSINNIKKNKTWRI
jgi:hypothetical protein